MSAPRTFTRENAPAGLDFTVEQPTGWVVVPLPDENPDFSDTLLFAPLAILMAPYAAIVFAVAARPAYADGTVAQWLEFVARERGCDPGTIEQQPLGTLAGVGCWAGQVENDIVMRARLVMVEDGERLLQLSCMAPDELWNSMAPTFERMLESFRLTAPRGPTAAIAPPDNPLPPSTFGAGARKAAAAPVAAAAAPGPLPLPTGPEPRGGDDAETVDEDEPAPATALALAEDMKTFDPEHPLNVRLRDVGAGLVPNVLDYHEQERWATLGPGSLRATLRVPFGWHVVDDGRRALVFDAGGHTQISLQLLLREGRSDDALLTAKVPELQKEWPGMRHVRTEVQGMQCLLVRDATIEGKPIEQAYILRGAPDDLVLQTRVTSSPEKFTKAADLAEVLLRDLQFAGEAS
jgi:hypothetical protein